MADDPQLTGIVQRMIDAGEPEENIAAVIQEFNKPVATPEQIRAAHQPQVISDSGPDWKTRLGHAMESSANPQTAGDLAGLVIPGQIEGAMRTAGLYAAALKQGVKGRAAGMTGLLSVPARSYEALRDSFPSRMTQAVEDFRGPATPPVPPTSPRMMTGGPDLIDRALQDQRAARGAPTGPPEGATSAPQAAPPPPPAQPTAGLSAADRAALVKQGYPPELIARIEQRAGGAASPAVSPMASHAPTTSDAPIQPDLQGPRIVTGAERLGRQVGMSKEDVRTAAGPVLDEARGDASPILPKNALGDIIDKLKSLPPGGPEREAYVQAATSGKTKWQVENIRRTLEHLGLIVPAAAALEPMRAGLMQLMSSHQPSGN